MASGGSEAGTGRAVAVYECGFQWMQDQEFKGKLSLSLDDSIKDNGIRVTAGTKDFILA